MISSEWLRRPLTILIVTLGLLCVPWLAWTSINLLAVTLLISHATLGSLQWGSFASFWDSLINGHNALGPPFNHAPLLFAFTVGFALLLWQWIFCLFRRRTLVRPRRLWLVTAIYFVAFTAFLQVFYLGFYQENEDRSMTFVVTDPSMLLRNWAIYACAFPLAFVALSLGLWLATSESAIAKDLPPESPQPPDPPSKQDGRRV